MTVRKMRRKVIGKLSSPSLCLVKNLVQEKGQKKGEEIKRLANRNLFPFKAQDFDKHQFQEASLDIGSRPSENHSSIRIL